MRKLAAKFVTDGGPHLLRMVVGQARCLEGFQLVGMNIDFIAPVRHKETR
jgi:hypothetical protein